MPQGTQTALDSYSSSPGDTVHDFTPSTGDTLKVALVSNAIGTITTQTNLSQLTEVTGTGYTAGGETSAITQWTQTGNQTVLKLSDVAWAQNAGGPQDIRSAVVYNSSKVGQGDLITKIDMTQDAGTTPLDLQAAPISIDLSTNDVIVSTVT